MSAAKAPVSGSDREEVAVHMVDDQPVLTRAVAAQVAHGRQPISDTTVLLGFASSVSPEVTAWFAFCDDVILTVGRSLLRAGLDIGYTCPGQVDLTVHDAWLCLRMRAEIGVRLCCHIDASELSEFLDDLDDLDAADPHPCR